MKKDKSQIKWASIQPLTGGMYLGAELAIGHPAEFILSYEGLDGVTYDKEGNIKTAGNEYNLVTYLKSKGRMPKYYKFTRAMFDVNTTVLDPEILLEGEKATPDYSDLDIVVAVPVCSGLSMVTAAKDDTKEERNCNMVWLAYYTLNIIKPKVYCFENAPTLMGSRGVVLRKKFETMAREAGYSLLYYKTDTQLHGNPQKRPRTFVVFIKHDKDVENQYPAVFDYVSNTITAEEFFKQIDPKASLNTPVKTAAHNPIVVEFIKNKLGKDWVNIIDGALMNYIIKNKLFDELVEFTEQIIYDETAKEKALKYFKHIAYKTSLGKNYYGDDICLCRDKFPSVQFRMIPNMLHPSGERMCTIREYLSLMGMPEDFVLYGDASNLPKIGQNVPVHTAEYITQQIVKILDSPFADSTDYNAVYQDNTKQTIKEIENY